MSNNSDFPGPSAYPVDQVDHSRTVGMYINDAIRDAICAAFPQPPASTQEVEAQEREWFESFARNHPYGKYDVSGREGTYWSSHTQIMWLAWQARAALAASAPTQAQPKSVGIQNMADALYRAGYEDACKERDYDPRGCDAWQRVVDALAHASEAPTQPEPVAAGGVPSGWALVPVEPTEEMLSAAHEGDRAYTLRNFGDVMTVMQGPHDHYVAMIAAAPPAPASEAPTQAQRIAELEAELDDKDAEIEEARRAPWPEWAEQILKLCREVSGYDGYDDADGVDLAEEVRENFAELQAEIERLKAKAPTQAGGCQASGEAVERLKFELRQVMLDYGAAERANDPERIRETSSRGVALIDSLAPIAAPPAGRTLTERITPEMLQAGLAAWKSSATVEVNVSGSICDSYATKRMDVASRLKAAYRAMVAASSTTAGVDHE